ncbi:MAG: IceA2 protein [Opitutaceae bacterium]
MPSIVHVVKVTNGRVLLYQSNGVLQRTITSGAASAVVQSDEVHVTMPDGRVRLYRLNGVLIRTI